jgi:hypothetical protein
MPVKNYGDEFRRHAIQLHEPTPGATLRTGNANDYHRTQPRAARATQASTDAKRKGREADEPIASPCLPLGLAALPDSIPRDEC